ncbi:Sec14p-like phosphatidylinositol transfer family protein [Perilla frutescens var. frutescens]|nr:Sec14p-like phosphatidylinositol transfer family protein [Perilla frutescens var. frutescens]
MAEEAHQTHSPDTPQPPPTAAEETEASPAQQPEPISEPPLASLSSLDLQKESLPPTEPPPAAAAAEENPKEAVTIVEKDAPLPPPPAEAPLETEHVTVTAASAASQPLAAALSVSQEPEEVIEQEKPKAETKPPPQSLGSFKEESNRVSDLSQFELKSLQEFKILVEEGIDSAQLGENPSEEVSIWGVPLMKDDRSDVVLLKFLRARDFKVKESFAMLKNTLKWRRDFGVDELLKEDLGDDLEKVVFMHGHDKEGHPVCYNVYGEFQNKDLYAKTFGDDEKRHKFLRWRIQFLERSIRKLDFNQGGVNTIFQVSDLKNSPGPAKRELRIATRQALLILQDNYPEFVAKQVFINVPWWYLAFYTMMSPFLTQRTKSKFVFASPSKTAETLFKYITPEQVPTQYGGLSVDFCECNPEFTVDDPATEISIKPATKQIVEIIVNEKCTLVWELRVVGWEVSYGAEYVPNNERGYTVIIQKTRRMLPTDEPVVSNSFNVTELGKILLTIDNPTTKKKKLVYRFKVTPCAG